MSDLTPDDEALISAARGGLEATPDDHARIKRKLFAQIGIATGIAGSAISTSTAASAGAAAGAGGAGAAAGAAATTAVVTGTTLATKLVLAAIVIGTAGGAIAIRQSAKTTTNAVKVASTPSVMVPAPLASAAQAEPTAQQEMAPSVTAATPTELPVEPATKPTATATSAATSTSRATSTSTSTSTATSTPTSTVAAIASGPTTVDAEAALLRNADAALKSGDAQGALALVDQHAKQFPNGILVEEREAERVVVLCALGRTDEARAAGATFLRTRPRSPLASRVRASCAGN